MEKLMKNRIKTFAICMLTVFLFMGGWSSRALAVGKSSYTVGSTVYHIDVTTKQSSSGTLIKKGLIYSTNTSGKKKKTIATIKNVDSIIYYYGGKLYLNASEDVAGIGIYSLNLTTSKVSRVFKTARLDKQSCAYRGYIIARKYTAGFGAQPLYSYNCRLAKRVTLAKNVAGYNRIRNKIFYVQKISGSSFDYTARIVSCGLNGKGKKVYKTLKHVRYIGTVSSNYVYYQTSDGKYYSYNFNKKKSSKVSTSLQMYGTAKVVLNDAFVGGEVVNATYTVYTSSKCSTKAKTVNGKNAVFKVAPSGSNVICLNPGTYYIKATSVPQNYVLSKEATKMTIAKGKATTVSIQIPRVYDLQTNYPDIPYNYTEQTGKTIYSSGCVPTSLGNILRNYMGVSDATTVNMCDYAVRVKARTAGGTSASKLLASASKKYGFTYSITNSYEEVLAHVRSGKMALAQTSSKPFADGGHIMAVINQKDGNLAILDPYWPPEKKAGYISYGITTTSVDGFIYVTEEQAAGINYYYLITKK